MPVRFPCPSGGVTQAFSPYVPAVQEARAGKVDGLRQLGSLLHVPCGGKDSGGSDSRFLHSLCACRSDA